MKNAIILCSGGLDSTTTAHYAKKKLNYDKIIILFFNYGQRNIAQERTASKFCAKSIGASFTEVKLNFLKDVSTSLLNSNAKHHKVSRSDLSDSSNESTKYYVPCRNTVFLVNALALAESFFVSDKKDFDIFVGFKCEGKESYPDTTSEFVHSMNKLKNVSTSVRGKIIAPLIKKDKEDIVKLALKLGVPLEKTFSCYIGKANMHCGTCLACRLRQEGFYWANARDNTKYDEKSADFRVA